MEEEAEEDLELEFDLASLNSPADEASSFPASTLSFGTEEVSRAAEEERLSELDRPEVSLSTISVGGLEDTLSW